MNIVPRQSGQSPMPVASGSLVQSQSQSALKTASLIFPPKTVASAVTLATSISVMTAGPGFLFALWPWLFGQFVLIGLVRGVPTYVVQKLFKQRPDSRSAKFGVTVGSGIMVFLLALPVGILLVLKGALLLGMAAFLAPSIIHSLGIDFSPAGWLHTAERLSILGLSFMLIYFFVVLPISHFIMVRALPATKALGSWIWRKIRRGPKNVTPK